VRWRPCALAMCAGHVRWRCALAASPMAATVPASRARLMRHIAAGIGDQGHAGEHGAAAQCVDDFGMVA